MPNEYGRTLDKTHLSLDKAEERGFIHRDYIAHCLRWSHIVKFMQEKSRYKTASILDVGCGREAPLIKALYTARMMPHYYLGVDAGHILPNINFKKESNLFFLPETNILDVSPVNDKGESTKIDVIVMLEALEHMEKDMGIRVLKHLKEFMSNTSVLFLSTPCFNGSKAANHVYEWEYMELEVELESCGFKIVNNWGTFASIKDYAGELANAGVSNNLFMRLREYYDVNYLATIFAPLFPHLSRNVLWKCILF